MESDIDFSGLIPDALTLALEIERIQRLAAGDTPEEIERDHAQHWQELRDASETTGRFEESVAYWNKLREEKFRNEELEDPE